MKRKIILASQSPRRKELLQLILKDFTVQAAELDERAIERSIMEGESLLPFEERSRQLVERLAEEKAAAILRQNQEALVIGADTVVVHEGKILGKPADEAEAGRMIRSYAGETHAVLTGVSIQTAEKKETFSVETKVRFFEWNEQMEKEAAAYIASGSPLDKAGAYGIQEEPALWVAGIEGDYLNVVGFPAAYVNRALKQFQVKK